MNLLQSTKQSPQGSANVLGESLALNEVCPSHTLCLDIMKIDNLLHPSSSYTFLKLTYSRREGACRISRSDKNDLLISKIQIGVTFYQFIYFIVNGAPYV